MIIDCKMLPKSAQCHSILSYGFFREQSIDLQNGITFNIQERIMVIIQLQTKKILKNVLFTYTRLLLLLIDVYVNKLCCMSYLSLSSEKSRTE